MLTSESIAEEFIELAVDDHNPKKEATTISSANTSDGPLRVQLLEQCSFNAWYPALRELTFNSVVIEINEEHIRALVNRYNCTDESTLSLKHKDALKDLEKIMDEAIGSTQGNQKQGVFFRFDTRSPKDASFLSKSTASRLQEALKRPSNPSPEHEAIKLLVEAASKGMRVSNASEALDLINESPRIWNDLMAILNFSEQPKTYLIFREWKNISLEDEFRVFVSHGKICAIGQYFHFLYFPKLASDESYLQDKQREIIAIVKKALKVLPESLQTVIIDVVFVGSTPFVLELNPCGPSSGAGLFNWEKDNKLLNGCEENIEFRVRKQPRDNFEGVTLLPVGYKKVLEQAMCQQK